MEHDGDDVDALLAELRRAGEEPPRALLDRVEALGPAAVRPLIALATDESLRDADSDSPEVWAPLHAVTILGELGAVEAVEPLLPLLARDDDWLRERLPESLACIGRAAVAPLRAFLFDRTRDMWAREGAAASLAQAAQHHPGLRDEAVAALVARLAPAETQSPEDETLNGLIISRLLDIGAREALPAIEQAYAEDRVDGRIVDLPWVRHELGLAPEPPAPTGRRGKGLRLWLRCTACGYDRPHNVERVYCDVGTMEQRARGEETPYGEYVIPQQITCPRCGAVDQYELTNEARIALAVQGLAGVVGDRPRSDDDDGPVVYKRFTVAGGREMHPHAAQEMYRQQVAAEPENVDVRVRYANVLHSLGRRDEAMSQYRAALQHDPSNAEACMNLGILAREDGDRAEARRMFERVLEVVPRARMPRRERDDYVAYAREELNSLGGRHHPTSGQRTPALAATLGGGALAPAVPAHKVGRNDPCPCGSGKKYKKCCGR